MVDPNVSASIQAAMAVGEGRVTVLCSCGQQWNSVLINSMFPRGSMVLAELVPPLTNDTGKRYYSESE